MRGSEGDVCSSVGEGFSPPALLKKKYGDTIPISPVRSACASALGVVSPQSVTLSRIARSWRSVLPEPRRRRLRFVHHGGGAVVHDDDSGPPAAIVDLCIGVPAAAVDAPIVIRSRAGVSTRSQGLGVGGNPVSTLIPQGIGVSVRPDIGAVAGFPRPAIRIRPPGQRIRLSCMRGADPDFFQPGVLLHGTLAPREPPPVCATRSWSPGAPSR